MTEVQPAFSEMPAHVHAQIWATITTAFAVSEPIRTGLAEIEDNCLTTDEVAAWFANLGIVGLCKAPRKCAVAQWALRFTGVRDALVTGECLTVWMTDHNRHSLYLPPMLAAFVTDFDAGSFAELRATGADRWWSWECDNACHAQCPSTVLSGTDVLLCACGCHRQAAAA